MLPSAGGRSDLARTAAAARARRVFAQSSRSSPPGLTAASGIAAVTLIAAEFCNSSRLFIVRSYGVKVTSWHEILRGRATGRNANYRSIPAKKPDGSSM